MAQNIYDNPAFFSGYTQLPRQTLGLDGAPEWPTVRSMLPDLQGKRVADLGCGFGWASRWMAEHGATVVTGYDLSENMINRARTMTEHPVVNYLIADLQNLELPAGAFDLVYSSLAFHYIQDFTRLTGMMYAALAPLGVLVFTIEHPIYMAATNPEWTLDQDGQKSWPISGYSQEGERRTKWFVDGVVKYHRTLATTLNTLIQAGFVIDRLEEFAPSEAQVAQNPGLKQELDRPMFLLISARKAEIVRNRL